MRTNRNEHDKRVNTLLQVFILLSCSIIVFLLTSDARADKTQDLRAIKSLALKNGYNPSKDVINAIYKASKAYHIDFLELTAIGIIETGLGKYNKPRHNTNKTVDVGIFQINTINKVYCKQYNLKTAQGSAFCAAKLLNRIKTLYKQDKKSLARYHSNTPKFKKIYFNQITKVLALNADK